MIKLILFSLVLLHTACVCAAPPASGQYEVRKRRSDGLYDTYGVTLTNGQAIGQAAGIPAAVSVGGGSGTGTVTSVALTLPGIFSVTGSPITDSGTLAASLATQTANRVWAGPTTGSAATPTFRALVSADIPDLSGTYQPLITDGSLTIARTSGLQAALDAKLSTATAASAYQPLSDNLNTLSAGLGFTLGAQLVTWDGTTYAKLNSALSTGFGGTGIGTYAIGDMLYINPTGSMARLAGNATTTKKYLTMTGNGAWALDPVWEALGTLATQNGTFSGTSSGTNTGDQTITLLGDVTGSGTGTFTATLPTVNSNVGSFGSATAAPAVTVNAKGLITGVTTNTITPAIGSITGLGAGIQTALAINTGSAGAPVLYNGAGGTPSSITLTNGAALPVSGITSSTSTALGLGSIELGHASDTTLSRASAGVLAVEGVNVLLSGGALGTPSSGTLTNCTVKDAFVIPCSDETTALTTGTKFTFRMPYGMTLTAVLIEVGTAPTGSVLIVDVKENGTSIFSTKPQIAISATDSDGGAVPGVLSDTSLARRSVITVVVDQIGSTIAGAGLKVTLIGSF